MFLVDFNEDLPDAWGYHLLSLQVREVAIKVSPLAVRPLRGGCKDRNTKEITVFGNFKTEKKAFVFGPLVEELFLRLLSIIKDRIY